MACNCEGKTINIGMGCCQPVLAPIENYYTKWEVDELIESATTSGCCITPEEVDEKIEEAISGISFSGVTEEELNNAIASAKTEIEAEIPTVPTSNTAFTNDAGYLTEHQSLSGYATEQWVLDKNYITGVDLSNYATKDEIPTVPTKVSAFENDVPYLTEHQSLSGYVTDAEMSAYTYDKQTIDDKIAQGGTFDPSQYYNTAQTNNLIESAVTRVEAEIPTVPTSNTAFTNDAGYLTEHQSLSGYVTDVEMSAFTYDKATIDEKVASGGTFDPTQYYNKTATDALLNEKLDVTAYTPTDLSNYYNKQEVDNIVNSAKTEVEGEIPSLDGYATQQWVEDKHYITGVDLSDYALKSEIPIVPTSNTAFTNDAGYLTEHQSLSAYSTTDEVNSAITQATSGKANSSDVYLKSETSGATEIQNALNAKADPYSAGTGISIVGNIISATGGGGGGSYTAGRAIDLTNNVISFTLPISAGTGEYSIIENSETVAGDYAHAEGYLSIASGWTSHAEGQHTFASGDSSHAEGYNTSASCIASHAEGNSTYAIGCASHTEGANTIAYNDAEHASGRYNVSLSGSSTFGDSGNTLFTVGNGTGNNSRHNAFEIRQNGDIYITSGNTDIKLQDNLGGGVTSGEVQTMIDSSLSGYQEELSAGTGISISGNVISATGGSGVVTSIGFNYYSSINRFDLDYVKDNNFYKDEAFVIGDGLSVDENGGTPIISTTTKFWCGTQSEYDQILVKDPNTLYLIHN